MIENKTGCGIAVICTKLSSNMTFLEQKARGLENKQLFVMKMGREAKRQSYPSLKCVAIWWPQAIGFVAFNSRNAPLAHVRIEVRDDPPKAILVDEHGGEISLDTY